MHLNLRAALLAGAAVAAPITQAHAAQAWSFHADHMLGTSLDMVVVAMDSHAATLAAGLAKSEIARLDRVLSGWRVDSELADLNRAAAFVASPDLFAAIAASEDWCVRTGGAFSARLGELEALLKSGTQNGLALFARHLASVSVGLDADTRAISRPAAVRFAVDGLAKGYIIDRALEAARSLPGVQGVMLDIGGDLRCWGAAPGGGEWRVGVAAAPCAADNAKPAATIRLADNAVATSGPGPRGLSALNPATGAYATGVTLATVIAPRAADADALASAFSVMTPEDSLRLAAQLSGVEARIVTADGSVHTSAGWSGVQVADNAPLSNIVLAQAASAWPANFAVTIDYEIPNLGGGRRPRDPYVTIWISDAAGNPVRSLLFLAGKPRYMDENFVFWDRIGAAKPDLVWSVTKPTRPPGRYSLVWDGKDDAGKPVGQGKYILNVEGAREHGGHNIQRIPLTLGAASVTAEAPAEGELGATHVRYGGGA